MPVFRYLQVLESVPVKEMTFLREMIESGVINYGDDFRHSMEEGGWDLSNIDHEKIRRF